MNMNMNNLTAFTIVHKLAQEYPDKTTEQNDAMDIVFDLIINYGEWEGPRDGDGKPVSEEFNYWNA